MSLDQTREWRFAPLQRLAFREDDDGFTRIPRSNGGWGLVTASGFETIAGSPDYEVQINHPNDYVEFV